MSPKHNFRLRRPHAGNLDSKCYILFSSGQSSQLMIRLMIKLSPEILFSHNHINLILDRQLSKLQQYHFYQGKNDRLVIQILYTSDIACKQVQFILDTLYFIQNIMEIFHYYLICLFLVLNFAEYSQRVLNQAKLKKFRPQNSTFIIRNYYFLNWNYYFLKWNYYFLNWNYYFLNWNYYFLNWNYYFLNWNYYFLNWNYYYFPQQIYILCQKKYFILYGKLSVMKVKSRIHFFMIRQSTHTKVNIIKDRSKRSQF